jgi:hypothetical protein
MPSRKEPLLKRVLNSLLNGMPEGMP